MTEKIVQPTMAKNEVAEAPKSAPTPDVQPLAPEKKDPNHVGPQYQNRKYMGDGGFREYHMTPVVTDDPVFRIVSKSLGLTESESLKYRDDIEWIAKRSAEWLQDDDAFALNKFVRGLTKFLPSNGSRIYNVRVALANKYKEEKDTRLWVK